MPITQNDKPYVDAGTGAFTGPTEPEVFGDPDADDVPTDLGTGAVTGSTEPEVYVSEDHEGEPTGAGVGPSEPETRHEWPMQADGTLAASAAPDPEPADEPAPANSTAHKRTRRSSRN